MRTKTSTVWLFCIAWILPGVTYAGVYHDLGRPVIGAWRSLAVVASDPVLERDVLWSQECSQDGAVLFATDLATGEVLEEHDIPAREVGGMLQTETGVIYLYTYSGLNHPGNELLRFDPKRREIEGLGFPEVPRNRPATGVIGRDGNIYIGTHQEGRLFRFRVEDSQWEDLGQKVPPPIVEGQNIWLRPGTVLPDGRILASVVRSPPARTVSIDPATGAFSLVENLTTSQLTVVGDKILRFERQRVAQLDDTFAVKESVPYAALEGRDTFPAETTFSLLSVETPESFLLRVAVPETAGAIARLHTRDKTLTRLASLPFRGTTLAASHQRVVVVDLPRDRFAVVDLTQGASATRQFLYKGKRGSQICGLTKASDGSIYGTNIIGMHIFRHDPSRNETYDLGPVGWSGGEVYNTIDAGGKVFFGTYGGGYWGVYDPSRPWSPDFETQGLSPQANPRKLGQLGGDTPNATNRPFEYVAGPAGKVYIACRANYGHRGGALVEFDPETGARRLFRDLDRSVQTVTASEEHVFAGTSIHGGRGAGIHAEIATVFIHDPVGGKRLVEKPPVPDARAITCLRYDPPTQRLYGTSDNRVFFVLDPTTLALVEQYDLRSAGTPLAGVPEDVGMTFITPAHDGNVYGVTYSDLFRWNAKTKTIEYLEKPPMPGLYQIVEGAPGEFYMGAGTHLLKYFVKAPAFYR